MNKTMENFVEEITEMAAVQLPNAKVATQEVIKTNGLRMTGLTIMYPGQTTAPILYLDDICERIDGGDISAYDAAGALIAQYMEYMEQTPDFSRVFDEPQEKLYLRVMNTELNKEKLKNLVCRPIEDLSLALEYRIMPDATALVTKEILGGVLHMTADEAFEQAKKNVAKDFIVCPIEDIIGNEIADEAPESAQMVVISNKATCNGAVAAVACHESIIAACEALQTDSVMLLPSSTDEFIAIRPEKNVQEMREMVKSVNETLPPDKLLSDNVYLASRKGQQLKIAKDATEQKTERIEKEKSLKM